MPSAPKPGEPITSAFLQDVDRRAGGRPTGGSGSPLQVGPSGQVMVPGKLWFAFVECTQSFTPHDKSDPGTGKVKLLDYDLEVTSDEFDCDSLISDPQEEDQFWITFNERTGRFEVLAGGGSCECKEIHEIRIDGTATAGTITVAYTVGGSSGSASINYNSTASAAKTALVSGHSSFFTSSNIDVYDGDLPSTGLYVVFKDNLAGQSIKLPAVTSSLTGGGQGKAYRISAGGDLT